MTQSVKVSGRVISRVANFWVAQKFGPNFIIKIRATWKYKQKFGPNVIVRSDTKPASFLVVFLGTTRNEVFSFRISEKRETTKAVSTISAFREYFWIDLVLLSRIFVSFSQIIGIGCRKNIFEPELQIWHICDVEKWW